YSMILARVPSEDSAPFRTTVFAPPTVLHAPDIRAMQTVKRGIPLNVVSSVYVPDSPEWDVGFKLSFTSTSAPVMVPRPSLVKTPAIAIGAPLASNPRN